MRQLTKDEFNAVEEIKLIEPAWVTEVGKETSVLKKAGDTVKVKGNDKVQLIASGKGERLSPKGEDKKEK
ncbi:MAG: hypothetical protein A2V66_03670 [Ignavibacteria bacterium RBG_13_36_8]|nr:MAG: hypothetical protein A2V66_03670 [Ignavibacteria bacterium RBG_13_36_8]